jgi:hypothetical protein
MIGTIITVKIALGKSGLPILLAAVLNYASTERTRQFELRRELGTLASLIEDAELVGRDCSALRKRYEQLARLVKV